MDGRTAGEAGRKNIEYNGQMMTEYEVSQKQRHIERQIGRWKRENTAMQAAGLDTTESAIKLKKWQAAQRDFVNQPGLKRQYERERVPGFDLSAARQADKSAEKAIKGSKAQKVSDILKSNKIEINHKTLVENAREGKRHKGIYEDAKNHSKKQLEKSINSHNNQVIEHAEKMKNPAAYDAG